MNAERWVTPAELRRSNGDGGARVWVAVDGEVFDVTDCARWRGGLHEGQHFPGQELAPELREAPHGAEVLSHPCVKRVGRLRHDRAFPK